LTHSRPAIAPSRALGLLNLVLLVLVLGAAGAKMGLELSHVDEPAIWGQGLPLEAADYLQDAGLPGRMFNSYNWGGYLIWRLYPDQPVFVDGRTDLYALNSQVLEDYSRVHWQRPGWQAIFDKYGIGYVVTERTGLLDVGLAGEPGWEQVHSDEVAVVYRRGEEEP
jgi:hypothetical protein